MIEIRRIEQGDLLSLLDIYNHYVRETIVTFDIEPRTLEQWQTSMKGFSDSGRYQCFVAVKDGVPVGLASSHRYHERAAYEATVYASVYLSPVTIGQGIGTQLYAALFEALGREDVHRVLASITVPNEASIRLHSAFGFEQVGLYREIGRKFGQYRDVAVYMKAMD